MRRPWSRRRCSRAAPKRRGGTNGEETAALPRAKRARRPDGDADAFDRLHDDLVLTVLARVAAAAASPADVAAARLTCRRFRELAAHSAVLSRASAAAVAVRAGGWSEAAHRFLRQCAAAGSVHACYFLGMLLAVASSGAILLPREQGDGGGAAGARRGERARGGAVRAGGGAVQRQRRRQGGQGPARGRRAVRARRVARPRPRAARARPLPPGRLRRAPRRRRRSPPPPPRHRARAVLVALPPRQLQRPHDRRGGRGQPVHGGVVGVEHQRDNTQRKGQRRRRGRRRGAAPVLAGAMRAARDAAARVPALLGVRRRQLLLPRVPGAPLEARAPRPVRRRGRALSARRPLNTSHVRDYVTCTYT